MAFNIWDILSGDYISERKMRYMDKTVRPPVKSKSFVSEFRPHDQGRGQEINSEYSFQIPFRQQKLLYQRNPWVKKCIDHIAAATAGLNWQIIPKDDYEDEIDEHMEVAMILAKELFERPNQMKQTFGDLIRMLVRDLKIMDAACLEKVRDSQGRLTGLKVFDASVVRIDIDPFGQVLQYVQDFKGSNVHGLFSRPNIYPNAKDNSGQEGLKFSPKDVIYFKLHPRSESPYGSSPIASLVEAIYADMATDTNLYHFLSTGGVNVGFMTIGQELDNDVVERVRLKFKRSLSPGMRYEFPIIAASEEIKWNPMQITNSEQQMAELQEQLRNKILAVLSIPPNELGLSGSQKGQVYSQQDVFWGNAIIPMVKSIAERLTNEVIAEFDNRLKFEFLPPTEYQYEAVLSRVITLEQEGLVDDKYKYKVLGLKEPTQPTYVQDKKRLELEQMEYGVAIQKLQAQAQMQNAKFILDEPRLQYEQLLSETKMMMDQGGITDEEAQLQLAQIEAQKQQMQLQKMQMLMENKMMPHEMQLKEMELKMKLMEVQSAIQEMSGQTPQAPKVSLQELIQGIRNGQVDHPDLAALLEQGNIDEEGMKLINNTGRTIQGVEKLMPELQPALPNSSPFGKSIYWKNRLRKGVSGHQIQVAKPLESIFNEGGFGIGADSNPSQISNLTDQITVDSDLDTNDALTGLKNIQDKVISFKNSIGGLQGSQPSGKDSLVGSSKNPFGGPISGLDKPAMGTGQGNKPFIGGGKTTKPITGISEKSKVKRETNRTGEGKQ